MNSKWPIKFAGVLGALVPIFPVIVYIIIYHDTPDDFFEGIRGMVWFSSALYAVVIILFMLNLWRSSKNGSEKIIWTIYFIIFSFIGLIAYSLLELGKTKDPKKLN